MIPLWEVVRHVRHVLPLVGGEDYGVVRWQVSEASITAGGRG